MDVGLLASAYATAASTARQIDVGLLATVVGSAAAVIAVGVALWQVGLAIADRRRARRQAAGAPPAPAQRTAIDQSRQQVGLQVIVTGDVGSLAVGADLASSVRPPVPAVGASLAAPLGLLPVAVRGRDALLGRLRAQLEQGGLVVLAGPGGVGKSTIARELIRRTQDEKTDLGLHIWWLSAASPGMLAASLFSVAQELGATEPELRAVVEQAPDGPDRLWGLLERSDRRWLLAIDNADNPELLAAPPVPAAEGVWTAIPKMAEGTGWARPGRRGLVLVTSRQRSPTRWGGLAKLELLGVLADQEAGLVLRDLAPGAGTQEQAEAVGRRLGGLPLALHLAGSYLGSKFARWRTFEEYSRALDREPASTLSASQEEEEDDDDRAIVMRTWELSLDDLAGRGVGQARALLRVLSCYAPALPIPLDLLDARMLGDLLSPAQDDGGAEGSARRLELGLRGLSSLGLIEAGGDAQFVVVHPVIAATNRAHLVQPQSSDPM